MYLTDPTLYGATLPKRDIPFTPHFFNNPFMQTLPWQGMQPFLPYQQGYGFEMPYIPQQAFYDKPYIQQGLGYNMPFVPPVYGSQFVPPVVPPFTMPFYGAQFPWWK